MDFLLSIQHSFTKITVYCVRRHRLCELSILRAPGDGSGNTVVGTYQIVFATLARKEGDIRPEYAAGP
jgi:hypothetical protein